MKEKVLETIKKHKLIEEGDKLVIGLSGGPDSIALLYVLLDIQKDIDFSIHIAHVNHGIRGKDALADEKFVENLAKKLDLPYYSKTVNMNRYAIEKGISSEEAGRELRYGFFREILNNLDGGKIAVAHNKNDQAETLLMRFFRGTGIDGLKGMEYINHDIIRPILGIEREEIEKYLLDKNIESRLDKTNLEPIYNRNKIRLELIPHIEEEYNPNIIETLWRTSKVASIDSDFLEEYTEKTLNKVMEKRTNNSIILNKTLFLEEHRSIQQRIIRNCIYNIEGNLQGFTKQHISNILKLFLEGGTGKSIDLINNFMAKTSYEEFIIEKNKKIEIKDFSYKIKIEGFTYVNESNYRFETGVYPSNELDINRKDKHTMDFDFDKISGSLYCRNRKAGDRFVPQGMKGSKKIKDYFIDEKVPKEERDRIPLITDGKNILWVVGYRSSELYKVEESTKNILRINIIDTSV